MNPAEEWERVKQIFDAALNLPTAGRPGYVQQACEHRPHLEAIVLELLANHERAGQFLPDEEATVEINRVFLDGQSVAGRFRIVRLIARGGMGEVYEAYDERLRLRVALKTMRGGQFAERENYLRFKREVWVTREVSHEGICRVYDLVEHPGELNPETGEREVVPCLTMKLLDGADLQCFLQTRRPLPVDQAYPLVKQMAEALQVLHDHGIVHRDLKPSNVMLVSGRTPELRAVLTDFGLAKPMKGSGYSSLDESGTDVKVGAPYFMAPEVLEGACPTVQSDIYSFGLLIDEMVTRTRAFPATSLAGILRQKLCEEPIPPGARADGLNANWERAILRCLQRNPAGRYSSVKHILDEIEGLATPAAAEAAPAIIPPRQGRKPTRRTILRFTSGALLVAAGGAASTFYLRRKLDVSLIVMPFENYSGNEALSPFCKWSAVELSRRLGKVNGVRLYYHGARVANWMREKIGDHLELRGRLNQQSGQILLDLLLVDASTGRMVWQEQFGRPVERRLELQEEIGVKVVNALAQFDLFGIESGSLNSTPPLAWLAPLGRWALNAQESVPPPPTTDRIAYDLYTRALQEWERRTIEAAEMAIELLRQAVERDPRFALAYATLADLQSVLMDLNYRQLPHAYFLQDAEMFARRAVQLDAGLSEAHTSLAAVEQMLWDYQASASSYRRALDLHPRSAVTRRWYAGLCLQLGRFDECLQECRLAMEHDPGNYAHRSAYGLYQFYSGQPQEALRTLDAIAKETDFTYARPVRGQLLAYLSCHRHSTQPEAYFGLALKEADLQRRTELASHRGPAPPDFLKFHDLIAAMAYGYHGELDKAERHISNLRLGADSGRLSPETVARAYAAQESAEKSLDYLERAIAYKDRGLMNLAVSPFYLFLKKNARFQAVLKTIGLPLIA